MKTLTIDWIKENGLLVFEVITGSKAYGLNTAESDTDIRGVFILPKEMFYSLEYSAQVANETNDIVYYELKRFIELLAKNNPNIMEMLNIPEQFVLQRHEIMEYLKDDIFLSKLCEKTFANYAFSQIKKAYGLEKKIVNPVEAKRKSVMDFCFVHIEKEAVILKHFLEIKGWDQKKIGLSAITHLKDCYNLFHSESLPYKGIIRTENANDVTLSTIPKEEKPVGLLYFNKDGYSAYCKKHKEYWEWVGKRNEVRYNTTMSHGKSYDSKNMMHVFRLLLMAKEIGSDGKINVHRKDREFLLSIREGKYEYDELLAKAGALKNELPTLFRNSALPDTPDFEKINKLLIEMRESYYEKF